MMDYQAFLKSKLQNVSLSGFIVSADQVNRLLFKFQNAIVRWAVRLGKAAIFAECGLGKTFMQLEWARLVAEYTGERVIILAPLAVAGQTVLEALKLGIQLPENVDNITMTVEVAKYIGITIKYCKDQSEVESNISITNYDRLDKFDCQQFAGVVLDESSILKAMMGKTKQALINAFKSTPYKLCCTATPAPNDYVELGTHAEFLGIKKQQEMLATWFINDASDTGTWRLKKPAAKDFWRWVTSWAVCISEPKDLGDEYDMPDFVLPPLNVMEVRIAAAQASIDRAHAEGRLIPDDSPSSTGMHKVKRESLMDRVWEATQIVMDNPKGQILIWCDTDYEADALEEAMARIGEDYFEVRGGTKNKEDLLLGFANGDFRILITKPSIAGLGLNYQNCANHIMIGVSYSFEKFYQAIRRSWRFGQKNTVNVWVIYAETEGNIMVRLKEKQSEFKKMQKAMTDSVKQYGLFRDVEQFQMTTGAMNTVKGDNWTVHMGDCVQQIANVPDNSVGLSIYSPPFPDVFMYTDSVLDMGNCLNDEQFQEQYAYLVPEIFRITMPGRLSVVHCIDLPSFKFKHGQTGLRDFPGEIIKAHVDAGWIYHSRVTIWKSPVTEMTRTKAHALLHKNFVSKAEQVRQGCPDYLVIFRKPDPNDEGEHVTQNRQLNDYIGTEPPTIGDYSGFGKSEQVSYSIALWQRYASPVWFDINQTNVLNVKIGRDKSDERHIAPLQLDVAERCIDLWSNKNDTVFTPFMGIGSEIVSAIKLGRRGVGIELKESYFNAAVKFIKEAEADVNRPSLFDLIPENESVV